MNEQIKSYLHEHGLTEKDAENFGLKISENKISIPVLGMDHQPMFWKHRHFTGEAKYTYDKGSTVSLFGADQLPLFDTQKPVFIVEGEMDAMCLWASGRQAVSSTGGAGSWKDEWNELFKDFKMVRIVYDRDKAGFEGTYRVWHSFQESGMQDVGVGVIPIEKGKDLSEMVVKYPEVRPLMFVPTAIDANKGKTAQCVALRKSLKDFDKYAKVVPALYQLFEVFRKNMAEDIRFLSKPKPKPLEGVDIAALKRIPITDYVQFHYGVAPCVFHSDKNPSMHYNDFRSKLPNTVKCYACGMYGDIIDVVMAMEKCEFRKAVEILKGNQPSTL